ncbi:MAG: ABC transporter permease [Actinomycetota bacterium]|nr:ABC transporter permease [Actinomycetota bacterium]
MDVLLNVATLEAAIRLAVPVALAALGALVSERSGVLNLGLEGMMLCGALGGYAAAEGIGSPWVGLGAGILVGALCGGLMALLVVTARANQVVTGIAFTLLAGSATTYVFQLQYSIGDVPPRISRIGMGPLVVLTLLCVVGVWLLFTRTTFGLSLAAVGEAPESADALGYRVVRLRWIASMIGGGLAGLGGAALVCGPLGLFIENVTAGRGWVALALVVFAGWRPWHALGGALLFGLCDAAQLRLQGTATEVPYEVFLALPYAVTLIALVIRARASHTPSALGVPFVRGAT